MDIRQLKYFMAVAEKLSFTEAAKSLYVAQSAVSQQISELERKLDIPLFDRNRRSVKLTPAGHVLYDHTKDLLKRFDEAEYITKNAHKGFQGHLRIGYIGYGDRSWMPPMLRTFRKRYPDITLDIHRYNQGELIKALNEDVLDLAITFSFGLPEYTKGRSLQGKINRLEVYKESISVTVAADSDLAKKWRGKTISLDLLADESFIIQNRRESPQGFDKTLQLCNESGFSPYIVDTPNSIQTVLMLVEANLGIALLPSSIEDYAGPNLSFISLDMDESSRDYDIVAAWKANNTNPSLTHFIDIIEYEE